MAALIPGRQTPERRGNLQHASSPAPARPIMPKQMPAHVLQRQIGNSLTGRLLKSVLIQPKLTLSQPDDESEREADRVADRVMRMPEPRSASAIESSPKIQRMCTDCEDELQRKTDLGHAPVPEEEEDFVQAKVESSPNSSESTVNRKCEHCQEENVHPQFDVWRLPGDHDVEEQHVQLRTLAPGPVVTTLEAANVQDLKSGGSPLPETTRAFFEPRFGADFSEVRLHTDFRAEQTANSINAKAFTVGRDIAFAAGQYVPGSAEGQRLLAHELTHVVQQGVAKGRAAKFAPVTAKTTVIQREPNGGMTSSNAPASVSTPTPGPSASIPTAGDITNRDLIKKALESGDPADVKLIKNFVAASQAEKFQLVNILLNQTWVGPYDEYALEDIWKSFGESVVAVASTDVGFKLWQKCIERGANLDDLPAVEKLREKFESDIKTVVSGYLFENRQLVLDEMKALGIPPEENAPLPAATPNQTDAIKRMQAAAAAVAKLQRAQEEARKIPVGYEVTSQVSLTGGEITTCSQVRFDPHKPPMMKSSPGNLLLYCPSGPVTPYDEVKEKYDKATESIEGFLTLYPSVYAISREGQSATTTAFAGVASPAQARQQLGVALRKLVHDIEETQIKLNNGKLNPLDLTPIHDQLIGGLKAPSGIDWKLRLPESVATDMVKEHQFSEALKSLGLQTAAAALFLLAPFTGGASIYVMLAGLAVTGVKLYLSTEQYEKLALAAKSSPKPGTELVTKGQVDDAKMAMEADQIAFALAALAVGTALALKLVGAIKGPPKLTEPQGLSKAQFAKLSSKVRQGAGHLGDDIRIHGSRAAGTAKPTSDVDIAIRVPKEKFDVLVKERFGTPNPGSAKERTMLNAIETGKIQAGEAGLRGLRQSVAGEIGMEVDISVVRIGGPFDQGPWIPLQ